MLDYLTAGQALPYTRDMGDNRPGSHTGNQSPAERTKTMTENTSPVRTASAPTEGTDNTTPQEARLCYCGCGEEVGEKSYYRPGHDSRHVGIVARQVVASDAFETITNQLPTVALQFKAWNMAYRLHTAEARRLAREAKKAS